MKQIWETSGIELIFENKSIAPKSGLEIKNGRKCTVSFRWLYPKRLFLPSQVVLNTSRRREVDLGSLWYQVGSDWHTKVTPASSGVAKGGLGLNPPLALRNFFMYIVKTK